MIGILISIVGWGMWILPLFTFAKIKRPKIFFSVLGVSSILFLSYCMFLIVNEGFKDFDTIGKMGAGLIVFLFMGLVCNAIGILMINRSMIILINLIVNSVVVLILIVGLIILTLESLEGTWLIQILSGWFFIQLTLTIILVLRKPSEYV